MASDARAELQKRIDDWIKRIDDDFATRGGI